ncbi:SdpI family protein [Clostridium sp. WILCCON 0269]|uniref:SdpI family protein n=1 Tax=Candidatus Clostridium eludens TaxID=3381663 RepID=A0ABW8SU99_9CLOT
MGMIWINIFIIVIGFILKLWPPECINTSLGYKTPFAMKNQKTWNEGNRFAAIMLITGGVISLIFSLLISFLYKGNETEIIRFSSIFTVLCTLSFVFYTEIHLRKIFNKDGIKKL